MSAHAAACPVCGQPGSIGAPCQTTSCMRRGYHYVPSAWLDPNAMVDGLVGQRWDDVLLIGRLDAGAVGQIYVGLQMPLMMQVAVKILATDAAPNLAARLQHEAAALARLSHPHIVRLFKYGMAGRRAYLVMEYIEGGRTVRSAADQGELDRAAVIHIIQALISALDAAHRQGIVHRDVKPENIMLQRLADDPNYVRLIDFGLVKFTDGGRESTMLAAGTPTYMAPEQISRQGIGPWTDWYAVAMIAAELLFGYRPYADLPTDEVIRCKLRRDFDPVDGLERRGLAPMVLAFFRSALAYDPTRRVRTTEAFRGAFAEMVAVLPDGSADALERTQLTDSIIDPGAFESSDRPTAPPARRGFPAEPPPTAVSHLPDHAHTQPVEPKLDDTAPRRSPSAQALMHRPAAPHGPRRAQPARPGPPPPPAQRRPAAQPGGRPPRPPPASARAPMHPAAQPAPRPGAGGPPPPPSQRTPRQTMPERAAPPAMGRPVSHPPPGMRRAARPIAPGPAQPAAPRLGAPSARPPAPVAAQPPRRQPMKTMMVAPIRDEPEVEPPTSGSSRWQGLLLALLLVGLGMLGAVVYLMVQPPKSDRARSDRPPIEASPDRAAQRARQPAPAKHAERTAAAGLPRRV